MSKCPSFAFTNKSHIFANMDKETLLNLIVEFFEQNKNFKILHSIKKSFGMSHKTNTFCKSDEPTNYLLEMKEMNTNTNISIFITCEHCFSFNSPLIISTKVDFTAISTTQLSKVEIEYNTLESLSFLGDINDSMINIHKALNSIIKLGSMQKTFVPIPNGTTIESDNPSWDYFIRNKNLKSLI